MSLYTYALDSGDKVYSETYWDNEISVFNPNCAAADMFLCKSVAEQYSYYHGARSGDQAIYYEFTQAQEVNIICFEPKVGITGVDVFYRASNVWVAVSDQAVTGTWAMSSSAAKATTNVTFAAATATTWKIYLKGTPPEMFRSLWRMQLFLYG